MITIKFENHGQHFIEWDVDENGIVTDSRPYEKRMWVGCKIHLPHLLRKGSRVTYTHPRPTIGDGQIKYKVTEVINHNSKKKA